MDNLNSPDQPAYVCYLILLAAGVVVAASRVNSIMALSPGRWRYLGTWLVFGAYVAVPIGLFWLLDYSGALHDTSVFAAILVGVSYRQILAGEIKNVTVASAASRLWSPFELWANAVSERIWAKSQLASERFKTQVQDFLAANDDLVAGLTALAYEISPNRASLDSDLAGLVAAPTPAGLTEVQFAKVRTLRKVERCLQDLRAVKSQDYGYLLVQRRLLSMVKGARRARLVSFIRYAWWFGNLRALLTQCAVAVTLGALLFWGIQTFRQPAQLLRYHHWRFFKINNTERDRHRTREYLEARLRATTNELQVGSILHPPSRWLQLRDLDSRSADEYLTMVVHLHHPMRNRVSVPFLIDGLRTANPNVRLRVHQTLGDLQMLDYPNALLATNLSSWVPSKNDSVGQVIQHVKLYEAWWDKVQKP